GGHGQGGLQGAPRQRQLHGVAGGGERAVVLHVRAGPGAGSRGRAGVQAAGRQRNRRPLPGDAGHLRGDVLRAEPALFVRPGAGHEAMNIRRALPTDRDVLADIWLRSVRATHAFLTEADIQALLPLVRDYLASPETELWVLCTDAEVPMGFMGLSGNN